MLKNSAFLYKAIYEFLRTARQISITFHIKLTAWSFQLLHKSDGTYTVKQQQHSLNVISLNDTIRRVGNIVRQYPWTRSVLQYIYFLMFQDIFNSVS